MWWLIIIVVVLIAAGVLFVSQFNKLRRLDEELTQ